MQKEGKLNMAKEKVLIIAVKNTEQTEKHFLSSLDEIVSLTNTAGGEVEKIITQNRHKIHPATYLGEGKVTEIKEAIDSLEIDLVISNDELSAGQLRNLSDRFQVRLIDRSQLILDIFAQRAETKEGQLQVELAQLQYLLPRLRGQGLALSRLAGGIGTRGPGETKLESDQRHIRRRVDEIKRRLESVVKQREQYRKRRRQNGIFQIAIVGYTNAGKSTIFNYLTESTTLSENLLFATLDPLTRQLQLPSGFKCLITDTVGFLQDLPTTLIAAFRSTLEEVSEADFILHVVDGTHEDQEQHQTTVHELLEELDAHTIPQLTVYNKKDIMTEDFIAMNHPYLVVSAFDEDDMQGIIEKIESMLMDQWEKYEIYLKADAGKYIHRLESETIVTDNQFNQVENQYIISGYIPKDHQLQYLLKEQE